MSVAQLVELIDRFGPEIALWPRDAGVAARRLLAESHAARTVLARAGRLDRVLSLARAPSATAQLRARLLAAAPVGGWRELLASLWPFGPVWRPAFALFGFALIGVLLGSSDAATVETSVSVNGALSEEILVISYTAPELLDEPMSWLR